MSDEICIGCNLCCDGTLFDYVVVAAEEQARLGPEAVVHQVEGRMAMRQACFHLGKDGYCGIYEKRPGKCDAFDCSLLKRLDAGQIDRESADARVEQAKSMRSEAITHLMRAMPDGAYTEALPNARRMMHVLIDHKDTVAETDFDRAKRAYLMLAIHLEDHFKDGTNDTKADRKHA